MKISDEALSGACPFCESKPFPANSKLNLGAPLLRCPKCSFEWIAQELTPAIADRIYNQENYHGVWSLDSKDSEEPDFVKTTKRATADQILEYAGDVKGKSVLEVGCAGGLMLEQFKKRGASKVYGIELAKNAANVAKRRHGQENIWNGPIETCPNDSTFDFIIAVDLIEHVANPNLTLNEFKKRLKPKGKIILVLPDLGSISSRLMGSRWPEYKEEHRFYFSKMAMSKLAKLTGLRLAQWEPFMKRMSLPYFFHIIRYHSKSKMLRGTASVALKITKPFEKLPLPLPSGNALAVLET